MQHAFERATLFTDRSETSFRRLLTVVVVMWLLQSPLSAQVRFSGRNSASGTFMAAIVEDVPLLHTELILPQGATVDDQVSDLVQRLATVTNEAGTSLDQIARMNVYVATEGSVPAVLAALKKQWPRTESMLPPMTPVVTALPAAGAILAVDVVAALPEPSQKGSVTGVTRSTREGILPAGGRLYISGQAERGDSLADATRSTLAGLQRTLESLGRSNGDLVQLKAFVMPMSDHQIVRDVVKEFFAPSVAPPLILVEWKSSATVPIEIEAIAWNGPAAVSGPVIEHLWLPWLTRSPVYCRVTRVNRGRLILTGGLVADEDLSDSPEHRGEQEVRSVFRQLRQTLDATGS
ncbi:MAG: RidA family protein, partial [Planctomycetaceae bacterium]|nr:RidA family protein [Planctomycetaceae bacterium]